jgi:type VI secretion system protein ImpB
MMSQSIHSKLSRVRKPRVHITYDVETEGAAVETEIPFVVGVIGDFSGKPNPPLPPSLKDRKFVQIDRDNFNEVLARMRPAVEYSVPNLITGTGDIHVRLDFKSMSNFEPGWVAEQVTEINHLLDIRNKLRELLIKADRSPDLETLLEQIVKNDGMRKELADHIKGELEHSAAATSTTSQTALPEEKKS